MPKTSKKPDKMYALFAVGCENCNTPTDLIGLYDKPDYVKTLKDKLDIVKSRRDIKQDFIVYGVNKLNVTDSKYLSLTTEVDSQA